MSEKLPVIILCGGSAKRLRPYTEDIPKALVNYLGAPIIDWQLRWLSDQGYTKITLACGKNWQQLQEHLGDQVDYCIENKPLGTGGAIRAAFKHTGVKEAIIVNGDIITDFELDKLDKPNMIVAVPFACPYGVLNIGQRHGVEQVFGFFEKIQLKDWISAGIYRLNCDLGYPETGSVEYDVFPNHVLNVVKHTGKWKPIDTVKDLEESKDE